MNNTKKTLKNSLISVLAEVIILLLNFINRKLFIMFLDIEFLGCQTIFGNVFGLLSVAEFGVGNIISIHLYKEIITNNQENIVKLMNFYKWFYRVVALFIMLTGSSCYPILPYLVKNSSISWSYLNLIYFLQLSSIVIGYFLSYKRTLYIVTQREYKCVEIDLYVNAVVQILQFIFLALTRSYILYLFLQLSRTIIANIIIAKKTNKEFPFLKKKYILSKKEIQEKNIFSDLKNFLIHRISYMIYGSTDNIIISIFCGVKSVALYGNYVLIQSSVMQIFFYKLLNPIQATIGNILYSNRDKDELWKQFKILDVFSFFFASYISLGFLNFYQPFIELWLGAEFLLPYSFVVIFSVLIYFGAVFEIIYKYRSVLGDYKQDRWFMILSAVMNITVSIIGAKYLGITGVLVGTVFAYIPIVIGRVRFVVTNYFHKSAKQYLLSHFRLFLLFCVEGMLFYLLSNAVSISIRGILIRLVLWVCLPLIISLPFFIKNKYFLELIMIFKTISSNKL